MKHLFVLIAIVLHFPARAGLAVGTYNIRNFDYDERSRVRTDKPALETILQSMRFDLLGLNEINNTQEFERFVARRFSGYAVRLSTCGGAHGQRLGFLYNQSKLRLLAFNENLNFSGDNGGCYAGSRPAAVGLFEEIESGTRFYAIQLHLKSGGNASDVRKRYEQYQLLADLVAEMRRAGQRNVVAMGDFNTTGYNARNEDYRRFTAMVRTAGLIDLSANVPCSAYWWGGSDDGLESPSLLDHILVSPDFLRVSAPRATVGGHCAQVSCREASPTELGQSYRGVSDHCPQTVTIR